MQIRIGLLQIADCGPRKQDLQAKGEAYCRRAAAMGADIALFPELWYLGSHHFVDPFWTNEYEIWRGKNGHSIAFDPIAFTEKGSRDSLIIEAGEHEGVYLASFDLDAIREYRARESWGNAFRKPHRYGLLIEQKVEDPFVRVNIQGEAYQSNKR